MTQNNFQINNLLEIAINLSLEASVPILKIYNLNFKVNIKNDNSPVTNADIESNKIICKGLENTNIPILSEENKLLSEINYNTPIWVVDPLDGTKEFVNRNGEFTINIALVVNNIPLIGVVYLPVTKELYFSNGTESFKIVIDELKYYTLNEINILSKRINCNESFNIIALVSRSHIDENTLKYLADLKIKLKKQIEHKTFGSSLKFCKIAEGEGNVYPRFGATNYWDIAAGYAVLRTAKGKFISTNSYDEVRFIDNKTKLDSFIACSENVYKQILM